CAGATQSIIDRVYALDRPAQRHSLIAQCVLTLRALGVLQHLTRTGLAHIEKRIPAQMFGAYLAMELSKHASPAIATAAPCSRSRARAPDRCTSRRRQARAVVVR